jgi:hypothetical protein
MAAYYLGNFLRGYFEGNFKDLDTALGILSRRFLLSYPSTAGRHIFMCTKVPNAFGIMQVQVCYEGLTKPALAPTDDQITRRAKRSSYMY